MADLTPYVPRFLLQWEARFGETRHQAVDGTLVFADVSGFTRLSERLAKAGGKIGGEQMTDVINALFGDLLMVAARRGGEMLKYGGDAMLLLFLGDGHATSAAAACIDMQRRLGEIGRVDTGAGVVRLRMSVGVHSGAFDMFRVGRSHVELVAAGPAATTTCAMEAAADAGEVLVSDATAACLEARALGASKAGGRLLRRVPDDAREIEPEPLSAQPGTERFVSPELRSYLSSGVVDPDHRLASVAFIQLLGIDDRLAVEPATAVAHALDETLTTVQEMLHDHGVTFLATDIVANGTKVMAAAGAPSAVDAPEERLVRALLRIRDAGTPLSVRVGVHRGHVFAGDIGPRFRRTYTVIGDVTNTAARVMGQAKAGEVLTLREVLDRVPQVTAAEQQPFMAKGKTLPLVPFLVESLDAASRSEPPRLPFLGRDRELHALVSALTRAASGSGTAVEITGDVGIGKTRLAAELLATADAEARRLVVRCEPYEQHTPFFAMRHLLRGVLQLGDEAVTAERLHAALEVSGAAHLRRWLPLVAELFDVPSEDNEDTAPLEGRFRRQRMALVVEGLLEAAAAGVVLVVFEDVHWLDDASAELLGHVRTAAARHAWLVLTTRRTDPIETCDVQVQELGPLDHETVRMLLDAATAESPLPPHLQAAIVERAGGNPLFLTELLRAGASEGDRLPESLEGVVTGQVDALPLPARRLLRSAAVLGSSFLPRLLAEVEPDWADLSPESVVALLGDVVESEGDGRLRFRHALLRDVVYESLPYRQRRRLHRAAGEAIERYIASRDSDPAGAAAVLSLHFLRADEFEKAWRYARTAGDRARDIFANVEAVALYERALQAAGRVSAVEAADRARVLEELGDAANLAVLTDRARSAYRDARRLRHGVDAVGYARLCRKEARIAERTSGAVAGARWVRRGLDALEGVTSRNALAERASLWAMYAWMRRQAGHPSDAALWAQAAIAEGRRVNNRIAVANAYVVLDGAEIALGRRTKAKHATKALRIFERLGRVADQAVVLNNLGAHAYHRGEWEEAIAFFDRGRAQNARTGNHLDAGYGSWNIAEILVDQGRLEDAKLELDALAAVWRSVGFALGDSLVDWQRGRIEARWGDPALGLELLRPVGERFASIGLAPYVIGVQTAIAECLLRLGEVAAAESVVQETLARDLAAGGTGALPTLRRLEGYCAGSAGRIEDAWAALDASLHEARGRGAAFDVALALEGFAVLAALGGPTVDGVADRDEVLRELGVIALPPPPLFRSDGDGASGGPLLAETEGW